MPASVTAVRGFLIADSHDVPLPSPQPLNLASDIIPYASRVRFEVDVEADEAIHPLGVDVTTADAKGGLPMFPAADEHTFTADVRLPWGLCWSGEMENVATPLRFPIEGWPALSGGEYTMWIVPWPLSAGSQEREPTFNISFRVADPPAAGGAAPQIVSLDSGLANGSVLIGQPWLPTATVEDADDDVILVVFSVLAAGMARHWFLRDDGCYGDQQARDGVYSALRFGRDFFDRSEAGWAEDLTATFSAQALDIRGNWSEPVTFDYQIRNSLPPIWMQEPSPNGPNILEVGVSRAIGPPEYPLVWARCDSPDAWVFGRISTASGEIVELFDDGHPPDAAAGDGIHSNICSFPLPIYEDVVFYAVSKADPLKIGRKMAFTCPPFE